MFSRFALEVASRHINANIRLRFHFLSRNVNEFVYVRGHSTMKRKCLATLQACCCGDLRWMIVPLFASREVLDFKNFNHFLDCLETFIASERLFFSRHKETSGSGGMLQGRPVIVALFRTVMPLFEKVHSLENESMNFVASTPNSDRGACPRG